MDRKNIMKKNRNGFTLAELLVVIAILMILAGVSFVAVNRYIRNLHVLEMDSTAKEIFIVAQNHLSDAYASGELQRVYKEESDKGVEAVDRYFGKDFTDIPSYLSGVSGVESDDAECRYVIFNGYGIDSGSGSDRNEVMKYMFPQFSIDSSVSDQGNYIIVYEVKTATVLGVFYSGQTHTYFGVSPVHKFTDQEAQETGGNKDLNIAVNGGANLNATNRNENAAKEKRKHYPDESENSVIGRYIGDGRDAIPTESLKPLTLTVNNGAKLTATVHNPNYKPGDADTKVLTLIVKGLTSENTRIIELEYKENVTFTLDDVTTENGHFCDVFPNLIPGENVEIYAELSDKSAIATPVKSNSETVNSLFDGITSDSSGAVAEIGNIRHLENLDPEVSNLAFQAKPSTDSDLMTKASSINVTTAEQISDLIYSGEDSFIKEIKPTSDGSVTNAPPIYKYDGTSLLSPKGYYAIANSHLTSYDGQGCRINGINSQNGKNNNVGIFAETNIYDSANPANFNVKFELKNLSLSGCSFDATSGNGNVGGFVGSNQGNLEIKNCNFEGDSVAVRSGAGSVGVFVGNSEKSIRISGGKVSSSDLTISSVSGDCAGLVGHSVTSAVITNCLIEGNNISILSASGVVGGLVGKSDGAVTVIGSAVKGYSEDSEAGKHGINCYVTITSESGNAGGIIGESSGLISIDNCYTTGEKFSVTGNDAGGIIGTSKGGMDIKNSYCSSHVFAKENAGGFIGNIDSGSKNTIKWCFAGGHTVGGKYVTEPSSNNNIISDKVSGGFIGRTAALSIQIEYSYTTCSVYSSLGTTEGNAGGFIGRNTSSVTVNNCYSAGPVSIADGGTAGGFVGHGSLSAEGKNYYLKGKGFNSSFHAGGTVGNIANISPTSGTEADILAVGSGDDAYPWDSSLRNISYKGKYPYKTVMELSGPSAEEHPSDSMSNHHGDWTIVETSDISLSISNAEKLAAILSIDTSSLTSEGTYVSMVVDSQGGGTVTSSDAKAYMQFLVKPGSIQLIPEAQALININSAGWNISDSNNVIFPSFLNYKIKTTSEKTEYHIYLDDITTPGGNFASLFKCFDSELSSDYRFTPGEDIRITAESGFLSWSTLIDDASDYAIADDSESEGQITGVTNSIFAPGSGNTNYKAASGSQESTYYSDIDKKHIVNPGVNSIEYDETALILNFRHLQNLDTYISGVDNGYKKAKLCDDIWWKSDVSDENTAPAGKTPFINAIQSENGNTDDVSVYAYGSTEPVTAAKAFFGIINSNLKDFNGNQKKINNVFIHNNKPASASINAETNADAGLFRYFSFDSESKVHDLHLIYPTVISEHGEAGGLIGKLENTTSGDIIDHVEIKEPVVISKEKNAGGLVANVSNTNNSYKVWIKYTYVYGKHGLVRTLAATYSNKGPYAGGLIGSAVLGGYDIQDSGASVYVYADKASSAGGFIGNLKPKALSTISRCFVGGHINAGSTDYDEDMAVNDEDDTSIVHEGGYNVCGYLASGGFVGYLGTDSGSITFNNCFTTASVSSRSKNGGSEGDNARCIGGFIGQSQHDYQIFEKCYVAGKVFSDSNKTGAFIGERRLGGNEGPNAPQYTGCFVLHGVGFNADLKAVGNPAYTPSDMSKLDFVDYDSSKIKQEYTDSVTTVKFNQTVDDYPYIAWTGDDSVIGSKGYVFCGDWLKPEKLVPQAPLQLINGNRLTASIEISDKTRSLGALDGYDVTYLKIKGETSGNEFIYRILFKNGVVYKTEIDKWGNWTNVYDDGTVAAEIKNGRLNFYIDDISKKNGCYYLKMLWATAGENITVKVSKSEEGLGLSDVLQASGNSLFEKIVDNHDGSYTAYIANSRNLMNLNNTVSGIYDKNPGIRVSKAVLTDDIYWTYDGVGEYTAHTKPYLMEIPDATIYNFYGDPSTNLTITDIQSSTLDIFDGKDEHDNVHVLYNLHIGKNTDNAAVGLFSSTKRDLIIRNLQIKNPQLYTSGNFAGVLVGYVEHQLTIDNVIINGNVTVDGAQNAGGVIGYSKENINMSNVVVNGNILISGTAYAGGIIGQYEKGLIKMNNVGITSALGRVMVNSDETYGGCGGLIGGLVNATNMDINDCYSSVYVDGKGDGVGGFIGVMKSCSGTVNSSYASGHTYGGAYIDEAYIDEDSTLPGYYNVNMKAGQAYQSVGGFIGCASGSATISKCFSTNSVSSNVDSNDNNKFSIGGFVGKLEGQVELKHCYSVAYISDNFLGREANNKSQAGVFAGYVSDGSRITNSYCIRRQLNQLTPWNIELSAVGKVESGQAGVTLLTEASEVAIKAPSGYISTTVHHDSLRSNENDRYPYMNWTYANGAGPGIAPVFYGDW